VPGTATNAYTFSTAFSRHVILEQPLRNTGGACDLNVPSMVGVASATGRGQHPAHGHDRVTSTSTSRGECHLPETWRPHRVGMWRFVALLVMVLAGCGGGAQITAPSASAPTVSPSPGAPSLYVADVDGPPVDLFVNGNVVASVPCDGYMMLTPGSGAVPLLPWSLDVRRQGGEFLKHFDVTAVDTFTLLLRSDAVPALGRFGSTGPSPDPGACARWSAQPSAPGPTGGWTPGTGAIDEAGATAIAREFFAGAHGSGATVSSVQVLSVAASTSAAGSPVWRVNIDGDVTEAGRTTVSYGSAMWLSIDAQTGAVAIEAQG
jgi:hypothetical protein